MLLPGARPRHLVIFAIGCASMLPLLRHQTASIREFDIVIFGATGYVGSLLTASLFGDREPFLSLAQDVRLNSGVGSVRFALAGRNEAKLKALRDRHVESGTADDVGLVIADLDDPDSIHALAARSKVILSTVRQVPSASAGFQVDALLPVCIKYGTHLLDLDGFWLGEQPELAQDMDVAARATGTVYCPAAGEVAVVPDMATYRGWVHLDRPPLHKSSCKHFFFDGQSKPSVWEEASVWESYDTPLLRLSAAALGYGPSFTFSETSRTNEAHLDYEKNKQPEVRRAARFVTVADVTAVDGRTVTTQISGGEIDYEDTARIALEMALSLVEDGIPAAKIGGVWSPAGGWGDALLKRLQAVGLGVRLAAPGETASTILVREIFLASRELKGTRHHLDGTDREPYAMKAVGFREDLPTDAGDGASVARQVESPSRRLSQSSRVVLNATHAIHHVGAAAHHATHNGSTSGHGLLWLRPMHGPQAGGTAVTIAASWPSSVPKHAHAASCRFGSAEEATPVRAQVLAADTASRAAHRMHKPAGETWLRCITPPSRNKGDVRVFVLQDGAEWTTSKASRSSDALHYRYDVPAPTSTGQLLSGSLLLLAALGGFAWAAKSLRETIAASGWGASTPLHHTAIRAAAEGDGLAVQDAWQDGSEEDGSAEELALATQRQERLRYMMALHAQSLGVIQEESQEGSLQEAQDEESGKQQAAPVEPEDRTSEGEVQK